jgi:hypothetical protein
MECIYSIKWLKEKLDDVERYLSSRGCAEDIGGEIVIAPTSQIREAIVAFNEQL